jgi:hypothetical protein
MGANMEGLVLLSPHKAFLLMDNLREYLDKCLFFLHGVVVDLELIKLFREGLRSL